MSDESKEEVQPQGQTLLVITQVQTFHAQQNRGPYEFSLYEGFDPTLIIHCLNRWHGGTPYSIEYLWDGEAAVGTSFWIKYDPRTLQRKMEDLVREIQSRSPEGRELRKRRRRR